MEELKLSLVEPVVKLNEKSLFLLQVDEAEPPPKKPEVPRSPPEAAPRRPEAMTNGRRKAAEKPEAVKEKELKKKVIERFDKSSDTKCVTAFKESDTWD